MATTKASTLTRQQLDCLDYIPPGCEIGSPRNGYMEKILREVEENPLPDAYIKKLRSLVR